MIYVTADTTPSTKPILPKFVDEYLKHGATKGGRNDMLYKVGQQFNAAGYPMTEALSILTPRALKDGLNLSEITATIQSAYKSNVVVEPLKGRAPAMSSSLGVIPVGDDFENTLLAAFEPTDLVGICRAKEEDDKFVPDSAMIRTRDSWISLHRNKRSIGILCQGGGGGYICINPLATLAGGKTNENVSAYRHVLAEFDDGDIDEQRARLETSGLPISVIVTSGKRSVHGWVRVDAKDKQE
jgi:hypothetical protein